MAQRIWLNVPYRDKDIAKRAGARWDPQTRRWYAPRPGISALDRWLPPPPAVPTPTPAPGPESVLSDDPAVLLRDVTADEALPWAVRAPHPWFCHHCDSNCHAGEIQVATITPRRWRQSLIVCQPREWRHLLQHRDDIHWTAITHITGALEHHLPPATAIRWDPTTQHLQTVTGHVIDWRDAR